MEKVELGMCGLQLLSHESKYIYALSVCACLRVWVRGCLNRWTRRAVVVEKKLISEEYGTCNFVPALIEWVGGDSTSLTPNKQGVNFLS